MAGHARHGGDVLAHSINPDHVAHGGGGVPQVAPHPRRVVALEEHPLPGQAGQRHLDVHFVFGLPLRESILERDVGDEAAHVSAALDGGHVDVGVGLQEVGGHRVAGFVNGDRELLPFHVLEPLRRAHLLEGLGFPDVVPLDHLPVVPLRQDERLVDQVLDLGARVVGRLGGQLLDLLLGDVVADLGQVALVGADPPFLGGVADLVDAVDAAGPEQRRVQHAGEVGGHHDEDAVLGRRLGLHAQRLAHLVGDPPGLLQAGDLGEERLEGSHPAAAHAAAHDYPVDEALGAVGLAGSGRLVGGELLMDDVQRLRAQVGNAVALRSEGAGGGGLGRPSSLGEGPPAAQGVGFVEEHHHPAVAQGHLAQLAEQALDLEDADAEEHVYEGARLDEHEGEAHLSGRGLGDQGLSGPRRPPEQDSARNVAALGLDLIRLL